MRLKRAMESEGFQNYEKEWWLYSMGGNPPPLDVPLGCSHECREISAPTISSLIRRAGPPVAPPWTLYWPYFEPVPGRSRSPATTE